MHYGAHQQDWNLSADMVRFVQNQRMEAVMAQRTSKKPLRSSALPANIARVYSTTEGRQRFPDILQEVFGEKSIAGFERYGRRLGALIPMEALLLLAGRGSMLDKETRIRIQNAASSLLDG
jgi:hypothetical protein